MSRLAARKGCFLAATRNKLSTWRALISKLEEFLIRFTLYDLGDDKVKLDLMSSAFIRVATK
jgi:hypothetical protein